MAKRGCRWRRHRRSGYRARLHRAQPWLACALTLLLLYGCTAHNPWSLDSIACGTESNSQRLIYKTQDPLSEANLEFFSVGGTVKAYLSSPAKRLGAGNSAHVRFCAGETVLEGDLPLHEGRMRLTLPEEWTLAAIEALKEGRTLAIMVGAMEQTIQPGVLGFFEQLAKGLAK